MRQFGDALAILCVLLAAVACWGPDLTRLEPKEIYLSPDGSDWNWAASLEHPLKTIQQAERRARPGDTIALLPGIYRERVHVRHGGLPDRPITFRAVVPGTATISGAAPREAIMHWRYEDEGGGVFSTIPDWPIYFVTDGEKSLLCIKWGGLRSLRKLIARDNACDCFCYEDGSLYLFFADHRSPSEHDIRVHEEIPPPEEWGILRAANVRCDAGHIRFAGLRFDFGVGSGLLLRRGNDFVVEDCAFTGTDIGVNAMFSAEPIEGLRVERCLYHNFPQADWRRDWLSWQEVYGFYANSTLVSVGSPAAIVRNNLVVHGADLLRVTTRNVESPRPVEVCENLLAWATDDAIELDGHARHIRFHHNLIYDTHVGLGVSPVLSGPVEIDHNLFLAPAVGIHNAFVKLLNPWPDQGPIRNVDIHHNTFVGDLLCWPNDPVADVVVRQNMFAVRRLRESAWHADVRLSDNTSVPIPPGDYPDPGQDRRYFHDAGGGGGGTCSIEDYRGALPPGGVWSIPRPGPAWFDYSKSLATASLETHLSRELISR